MDLLANPCDPWFMNTLRPFQATDFTKNFQIQASLLRKSPFEIHLEFYLKGPLASLQLPPPEEPARQDNLWQSTCFEAFFEKKQGGYIEINCSPNGHWNAYEFTAYREKGPPLESLSVRLTRMEKEAEEARFFIQILCEEELPLERAGLTVVLENTLHEKSYWALHHPASQADFHHADGWTLSATPATR